MKLKRVGHFMLQYKLRTTSQKNAGPDTRTEQGKGPHALIMDMTFTCLPEESFREDSCYS